MGWLTIVNEDRQAGCTGRGTSCVYSPKNRLIVAFCRAFWLVFDFALISCLTSHNEETSFVHFSQEILSSWPFKESLTDVDIAYRSQLIFSCALSPFMGSYWVLAALIADRSDFVTSKLCSYSVRTPLILIRFLWWLVSPFSPREDWSNVPNGVRNSAVIGLEPFEFVDLSELLAAIWKWAVTCAIQPAVFLDTTSFYNFRWCLCKTTRSRWQVIYTVLFQLPC